jgi:hypothetical protein
VTDRPSATNEALLPVNVVTGAPDMHHKHDPSDARTTSRCVAVSTNAIARPFGEKRGCIGWPQSAASEQI